MGIFAGKKSTNGTGGSISIAGQYTVHLFTSSGTFTPAATGFIDVLAIGAGGDCGVSLQYPSGGGGAGAVVYRKFLRVTGSTSYPVIVGTIATNTAGGTTIFNAPAVGVTSVTAFGGGAGGGGGGFSGGNAPNASGGGGGGGGGPAGVGFGASTFGYPGGGGSAASPHFGGGGGGGAGGVGGVGSNTQPGLGGAGTPIAYFTGNPTDIVSTGGGRLTTPALYGNGGQSGVPGTSRPGAIYVRYI